jgi:hypothetical protein
MSNSEIVLFKCRNTAFLMLKLEDSPRNESDNNHYQKCNKQYIGLRERSDTRPI